VLDKKPILVVYYKQNIDDIDEDICFRIPQGSLLSYFPTSKTLPKDTHVILELNPQKTYLMKPSLTSSGMREICTFDALDKASTIEFEVDSSIKEGKWKLMRTFFDAHMDPNTLAMEKQASLKYALHKFLDPQHWGAVMTEVCNQEMDERDKQEQKAFQQNVHAIFHNDPETGETNIDIIFKDAKLLHDELNLSPSQKFKLIPPARLSNKPLEVQLGKEYAEKFNQTLMLSFLVKQAQSKFNLFDEFKKSRANEFEFQLELIVDQQIRAQIIKGIKKAVDLASNQDLQYLDITAIMTGNRKTTNLDLDLDPTEEKRIQEYVEGHVQLDNNQKDAVLYSLARTSMAGITSVFGPPGTGKTRVLVSVLVAALLSQSSKFKRIFVVTHTNGALRADFKSAMNDPDFQKLSLGKEIMYVESNVAYTRYKELKDPVSDMIAQHSPKKHIARWLVQNPDHVEVKEMGELKKQCSELRSQLKIFGKLEKKSTTSKAKDKPDKNKLKEDIIQVSKALRKAKYKVVRAVYDSMDVVFVTIGSSTADQLFPISDSVNLLLFDEGSNATEYDIVRVIAKFFKGMTRVCMFGDPDQLPPYTVSKIPQHVMSLMERLRERNWDTRTLQNEYRMWSGTIKSTQVFYPKLVPSISQASDTSRAETAATYQKIVEDIFGEGMPTTLWVHIKHEEEQSNATSFANHGEAEEVTQIVKSLLEKGVSHESIGVISPYKSQTKLIRSKLASEEMKGIKIANIGGFQGDEKPVIITSLTRSNPDNKIGFLYRKRTNIVMYSRAEYVNIVVGDYNMFFALPDVKPTDDVHKLLHKHPWTVYKYIDPEKEKEKEKE